MELTPKLEAQLDRLSEELANNTLALFLGSGLSTGAGLLSWQQLIAPLAADLDIPIDHRSDLLQIAQFHCNANNGNRDAINTIIKSEYTKPARLTAAHEFISELPVQSIWTTNYDSLIEAALKGRGKKINVITESQHIASRAKGIDCTLYKMHGDANTPERAVLTKTDYETYHLRHSRFLEQLQAELARKTFLFIGFGFSDYNIDYVLGRQRAFFGPNQPKHYFITKEPHSVTASPEQVLEERMYELQVQDLGHYGIEAIRISEFKHINDLLEQLRNRLHARLRATSLDHSIVGTHSSLTPQGGSESSSPTAGDVAVFSPTNGIVYITEKTTTGHPRNILNQGSQVKAGDVLCTVHFLQEHIAITSPINGEIIEIVAAHGTEVHRGETICLIRQGRARRSRLRLQHAPMEGTFYRAMSPSDDPYVDIGQQVRRGDPLCIIEVTKAFHEITSDCDGIVRAINFENDRRVAAGAYLMAIEESGASGEDLSHTPSKRAFVVQKSSSFGRFYSHPSESSLYPYKKSGSSVRSGETIARIRRLGDEILLLADATGTFVSYLKKDGDHVSLGEPITSLVPDGLARASRNSYRVQQAKFSGRFSPGVGIGQEVCRLQTMGYLAGATIESSHDGVILWIEEPGHVEVNQVIFRFSPSARRSDG